MQLLNTLRKTAPADVFTDVFLKTYIPGTDDRRYALVKRWLKAGDIIRLKRGVYTFGEPWQRKTPSLYQIAQMLYFPSYISLESALSYHGWIPEAVYTVTSSTTKRKFEINSKLGTFSYTPVNFTKFFAGVNRVEDNNGVYLMASPWRAIADYIYVYRKKWNDIKSMQEDLRISFESFKNSDQKTFNEVISASSNVKISSFLTKCRKEINK
jgi:hypothetical protein